MTLGVHSEVGQLRQAVLHRPGLRALEAHPRQRRGPPVRRRDVGQEGPRGARRFCPESLREKGVGRPLLRRSCWRRPSRCPKGRSFVLDRVCTPEMVGPALVDPLRRLFEDTDGTTWPAI
jgi:arginine deiminase